MILYWIFARFVQFFFNPHGNQGTEHHCLLNLALYFLRNEMLYTVFTMCGSRKYPCPPQGSLMEIPKSNESVTLKWNFQRGGGFNLKNLPWEGYGYFLDQHNAPFCIKCDALFNLLVRKYYSNDEYNSQFLKCQVKHCVISAVKSVSWFTDSNWPNKIVDIF